MAVCGNHIAHLTHLSMSEARTSSNICICISKQFREGAIYAVTGCVGDRVLASCQGYSSRSGLTNTTALTVRSSQGAHARVEENFSLQHRPGYQF